MCIVAKVPFVSLDFTPGALPFRLVRNQAGLNAGDAACCNAKAIGAYGGSKPACDAEPSCGILGLKAYVTLERGEGCCSIGSNEPLAHVRYGFTASCHSAEIVQDRSRVILWPTCHRARAEINIFARR